MNKKAFLSGLCAIAIVVGVVFNFSLNAKSDILPNSVLANIEAIEALARNEDPEGGGECPRNEVANLKCQIWKVSVKFVLGFPDISCETDPAQSHKCQEGTCPHGN